MSIIPHTTQTPPSNTHTAAAAQPVLPVPTTNAPEDQHRVFVGGLPYYLTEEQCRELLGAFGVIKTFDLVKDKETGQSKGCVWGLGMGGWLYLIIIPLITISLIIMPLIIILFCNHLGMDLWCMRTPLWLRLRVWACMAPRWVIVH